jgi:cytochrome d ubiquinol oxidase subunit I
MSGELLLAAREVVPARTQMGLSLGFHIIFACFGIAFPTIVLTAHWIGLRRQNATAMLLARRWSKVMAVIFAVGAVSGAVLSFELGLLWPTLMGRYGAAYGIPFSIEAVWFFVEAIFTGIYLYGWRHLSPWLHWWTGTPLVVSGVLGAISVVAANSWMNQPSGFTLNHGRITHVDPWSVVFNRATPYEAPHMIMAAYMVTGFLVAGVYAVGMLRGRRDPYHRLGFMIPFTIAAIWAPIQVTFGDTVARVIEAQQPIKFAAMELVPRTHGGVTEWIGGIYYHGQVYFGIGIPRFDSILVGYTPSRTIIGWNSVPPSLRPPFPNLIHLAFNTMVILGLGLVVLSAWYGWTWWYEKDMPLSRWFLLPSAFAGVAAVLAMESGWVVTEVGRQPWVVYHLLRTSDAVTTAGGITFTLVAVIVLYAALSAVTVGVPLVLARRWRREQREPQSPEVQLAEEANGAVKPGMPVG